MAGADDDEDWDSDFGIEPNINNSLQRKLTIGHLSKKKSTHQLIPGSPSSTSSNNNNNNSNNNNNNNNNNTPILNGITGGNSDFSGFDDDDDDDDWAKTSSPSKSILENRKEEEEDEDWDNDFGISSGPGSGSTPLGGPLAGLLGNNTTSTSPAGAPQMKILGIRADPTAKAEWDDDFVFNDSSESESNNNKSILTPAGNILTRARSGPSVLVSDAKLSNSIHELLQILNYGNDVDLSDKQIVESKTPPINSLKICSESELKKKVDKQNELIEIATLKESKLELSKRYFDLGMIYQQSQQTLNASNQFTTANKILQEYKDDFDTPIDENNDEFELNLCYQLGVTSKAMANIFNTTEYLKKALDLSQSDLKRYSSMHQKINMELGIVYQTTETPIYATKFFENLIRSIIFAQCTQQHSTHSQKDCQVDVNKIQDWSLMANACLQMAKTLKILNEWELALQFIRKAYASLKKGSINDRLIENECILLYGDINRALIIFNNSQLSINNKNNNNNNNLVLNKSTTTTIEDNATVKDFESEEEEDWDAELGLDVEDNRPVLQLAGQSPSVAPNKDRMPAHYKLIDTINNQNFEIVKYPKPSYLYSLTTPEGHLFLHEEALSKWLSSLIVKHLNGDDRALRVLPQKASLEELRNDFSLGTSKYKKNTKKWAQLNLEFCYTMHIFGHDEQCWDTIQAFFLDLRDSGTASPMSSSRARINTAPSPLGGKNRLSIEIDEKDATYHYALQMLYLAAKLWKPEEDASFKHMFQGLRNISVTNSPHVDLLVAETYSHHLHHRSREDSDNETNSDYTDSDEEPELRTRPDEFCGNEEEKINPLNVFLRVYQQCRIRQQQEANAAASLNTTASKSSTTKEFLEIGTKNAMVRSLIDIHFHLNGISPLTTRRLGDPYLDVNVNSQMADLLDSNHRMKLLTDLYHEIPTTFLKAKAAYALGLHAVDNSDLVLAEKFFFECLYIIDKCKQPVVGLPLVLSELAANASIGYAGVLLDNYKYQYAIVSFDNALLNYNIRKKKEYNTLLRRVAALARENDDINSAIYYYKQILNNYLEDDPQSKTNEIIYICDVISTLYWEKGNYKQSEEYLRVVFLILQKASSPIHESALSLNKLESPKFDNPIFFQLHLKLANLYLESYHFEKGMELLATMRKHQLPHGKLNSLLFLLAKSYTKLEWYDHCTTALNQLENEETSSLNSSGLSGGQNRNPLRSSATPKATFHHSGAGGSGNNKTERNLKYWELNCINYLHANKFPEALICIECAIEICPASSLNARGQYFYLRGKIFQKLVSFSNATLITFPTNLKPTADEWKEFIDLNQPSTTYTCTGDLIQEGVASYKRAYSYFKSIGDDVKIQKTVSRISETYLDRVFGPVALLHYQFDDVARLPHFNQSRFIQRDCELNTQEDKNKQRSKKKDEPAQDAKQPSKPVGSPPIIELKEFYISFEIIENPAILAMDINVDTCNIIQLLRNYMNMAELRYLQGDRDLAISFWTECRNLYFTMFCDGPHLIGKSAPLHFLKKLFTTCKRMIRFLFAFDQEFVNKNLMLVDSYLALEIDISQAKKRNIELNKPLSYESNPQISKIYMPYLGKSYTIGRNFKRKNDGIMTGTLSMDNIPLNNPASTDPDQNKLSTLTFNEKTKDEEKSVSTGDEVGEKIWGSLHAIGNEIRKYSIGKISQEELSARCKVTIKQILKIQQSYKNHLSNQLAGSPSLYPVPLQSSNSLGSLFRSQTKMNLNSIANGTDSIGRTRTPSNAGVGNSGNNWGTVRNLSSKYEELSFTAAQAKINASLQKLVYSLQVDNYFIHYVPHTGRKRFNRIGGLEELTPMPPPTNMLYLEIYLLSNANEKVSFIVSPLITLEKILFFLCNKPYWAVDNSDSKKKSFFGSFSRAANNSFKSTPKFIEKTTNFHNELISFLNSTIGTPGTDEDSHSSGSDSPPQERAADKSDHHHHPHTPTLHSTSPPVTGTTPPSAVGGIHHQHINTQPNLPTINITHTPQNNQDIHGRSMSVGSSTPRKVYSNQQLSLISFTKRMIKSDDPAYAKAYVSFDQLSYQISKVFSHREMRECSEQNPLQLFLFVNNGEEKKSQTSLESTSNISKSATNDQAITITPEILSSFLPLLSLTPSKDPAQEEIDRKKIITELKHTTFSSLFEILPTEKPDSTNHAKPSSLAAAKKQSKTFVFFGSSKDVVSNIPSTNISTTPLIFICSKSLQVFPWELIIPDFMVRYLTLYDLMRTNYIDISDPENQENGIIPCFISCCNSIIDKNHYNDPAKKDQQVKKILYNLFTTTNKTTARVSNENQPYLSPLIKLGVKPAAAKKKYKYLDFFDVGTNKISSIVNFLEGFDDSIHFPVFIFAYNDIVDLSQLPLYILRSKPICNVLFIPYSKQKDIMSRLFKIYDTHLKQNIKNSNPPTRKERYQFFISSVQSLKEEFYIPIALFNPTFIIERELIHSLQI